MINATKKLDETALRIVAKENYLIQIGVGEINDVIGLLIAFLLRLVVSYMLIRAIFSCYLSLRGNFIKKDQLKSVEATMFKTPSHSPDDDYIYTVYEYHVNGKSYRKTIRDHRFSPEYKITLYYRSNPKNVFKRPQSMPAEEQEKKRMRDRFKFCVNSKLT